jgi:hypothetical protein
VQNAGEGKKIEEYRKKVRDEGRKEETKKTVYCVNKGKSEVPIR